MSKNVKTLLILAILSLVWLYFLWLSFELPINASSLFVEGWAGWQRFAWWLVIGALVGSFFVLASLVLANQYLFVLVALPAMAGATFFGLEAIGLATLFLVIFPLWAKDVHRVLAETLNFRKSALYAPFLHSFYSAICAALAVMAYFSINSYIAVNGFTVPEAWQSKVMAPISAIVVQRLEDQIKAEFVAKGIPLPAEGIDQLLQTELQETLFKEGTTRQKLVPQSLNQAVEADLTKQLEGKMQQLLAPYSRLVVLGLAVLVFLTLKFFSGVAVLFGQVFLTFLFWFLTTTGFVVLKTETREVPIPSL